MGQVVRVLGVGLSSLRVAVVSVPVVGMPVVGMPVVGIVTCRGRGDEVHPADRARPWTGLADLGMHGTDEGSGRGVGRQREAGLHLDLQQLRLARVAVVMAVSAVLAVAVLVSVAVLPAGYGLTREQPHPAPVA